MEILCIFYVIFWFCSGIAPNILTHICLKMFSELVYEFLIYD